MSDENAHVSDDMSIRTALYVYETHQRKTIRNSLHACSGMPEGDHSVAYREILLQWSRWRISMIKVDRADFYYACEKGPVTQRCLRICYFS